jgi:hypothetical protein
MDRLKQLLQQSGDLFNLFLVYSFVEPLRTQKNLIFYELLKIILKIVQMSREFRK